MRCILLPTEFCKSVSTKDKSIRIVFPNIARDYKNHQWLGRYTSHISTHGQRRVNVNIRNGLSGEATTYKSIDTLITKSEVVEVAKIICPTEFLNSLDFPRTSPRILTMKIRVPVVLLYKNNPS